MPKRSRHNRAFVLRAGAAFLAAGLLAQAGCATVTKGPARTPRETFRELLGRNPGLTSVRAEVEARFSYAGRRVSLPGVLLLDALEGFRVDLLDPLDRPLAILYTRDTSVVQYRPGQRLAAALGVIPDTCRALSPDDWVTIVLAARPGPVAGESLAEHWNWGGRSLESLRGGELRRSVSFSTEGGQLIPKLVTWYCDDEPVMQLRLREWFQGSAWRLPSRLDVEYPKAGLTVRLELRKLEANPVTSGVPVRPQPAGDTRWTTWNLPR